MTPVRGLAPAVARSRHGRPVDPSLDEVGRFLNQSLARWAGRSRTLVITLPVPVVSAERFLDLAEALEPEAPTLFWDAERGVGPVAGLGATHRLVACGADRFIDLRRQADALWRRLDRVDHPARVGGAPRLWGGFAFDAGRQRSALWEGFADADFVLPRMLYQAPSAESWPDGGATLTLALRGETLAGPEGLTAPAQELERLWHGMSRAAESAGPWSTDRRAGVERLVAPSGRSFVAQVESLRRAMAEGRFEKVVAARCYRAELGAETRASVALRRLAKRGLDGAGGATRFAFGRGGSTFLGATPERLVRRRGPWVETEALAGTRPVGRIDELLRSAKDDHEHGLVVEAIRAQLGPWCRALAVASRPRPRRAGKLVHLQTPIRGRLAADRHLLELAARLHPTPAVGGSPGPEALEWIRRNEPEDRGWYAGGVGWFDASGDGELAVALRCGLLRGRLAHLFAGAGIVPGSDPRSELRETELKARTFLGALVATEREVA